MTNMKNKRLGSTIATKIATIATKIARTHVMHKSNQIHKIQKEKMDQNNSITYLFYCTFYRTNIKVFLI